MARPRFAASGTLTILLQLLPGNQDHDHDHHDHHDHPDHHHHHPVAALAWSDHDHHHHEDCQRWQLELKNQSKLKRLNRSSLVSVHSSGLLRWTTFQKIKEMFVKLKSKSLYSQQMGVGRGQQAPKLHFDQTASCHLLYFFSSSFIIYFILRLFTIDARKAAISLKKVKASPHSL